jgi:hypothetical protein
MLRGSEENIDNGRDGMSTSGVEPDDEDPFKKPSFSVIDQRNGRFVRYRLQGLFSVYSDVFSLWSPIPIVLILFRSAKFTTNVLSG